VLWLMALRSKDRPMSEGQKEYRLFPAEGLDQDLSAVHGIFYCGVFLQGQGLIEHMLVPGEIWG